MAKEPEKKSEIVLYQTEDGRTRLEVKLENETVWLTQNQMGELFQTTKQNVSLHIQNLFDEKELQESSVVKESLTTAADGKSYATKFYNLDVIISVGYRVKSLRGTQFRIWATQRLREYIVKGFTMDDGFVKEPAVVTRKNFNPAGMTPEAIEQMKLEDGIRLHESVKVELETYARETGNPIVKPFVLVIARDTTHAGQLMQRIQSETFFEGRYAAKVIQVDSSKTGAEEDEMVDRLNIIAHDRFQEIVDEAKKPDSAIRLQQVILEPEKLTEKTVTVVSQPRLESMLGVQPIGITASTRNAGESEPRVFKDVEEEKVAQITREIIRKLENDPKQIPISSYLQKPEVLERIKEAVSREYRPSQLEIEGVTKQPNIAAVVAKTTEMIVQQTISMPRIIVLPTGKVRSGFKPFTLKLDSLKYPAVSEELWAKHLRTDQVDVIAMGKGGIEEVRLEDYVVSGLVDFDDVSYDSHSDLLYNLASQVVKHFTSYLHEAEEVRKVLRCYQKDIARFVHAQMQEHIGRKPRDMR